MIGCEQKVADDIRDPYGEKGDEVAKQHFS
jgi:hypothetical protein